MFSNQSLAGMRTAGESNRWLQLYNADPVNTLRLSEYFRGQLQASRALSM
jgi:hypothetical protein